MRKYIDELSLDDKRLLVAVADELDDCVDALERFACDYGPFLDDTTGTLRFLRDRIRVRLRADVVDIDQVQLRRQR